MKKTATILILSVLAYTGYAQEKTGINTTSPKTTLDVVGNPTDANSLDGVMSPRLTGDQLKAKTYTADQKGTMVYVTAAATSPTGQTVNVKEEGQYVFDGTVWTKFTDTNDSEWKDGTNSSGGNFIYANQAKAAGKDVIITDNGQLGLGVMPINYNNSSNSTFVIAKGGSGDGIVPRILLTEGSQVSTNQSIHDRNGNAAYGLALEYDPRSIASGDVFITAHTGKTGGGTGKGLIFRGGHGPTERGDTRVIMYMNTKTGNVGINTRTPTEKLEVAGSIKIVDGSQGTGKVLTSDANGKASWQNPNVKVSLVNTQLGNGVTITNANKNQWLNTGTTITLPPGKWLVSGNLVFTINMLNGATNQGGVWIQSTFCDSPTATNYSSDITSNSKLISGGIAWNVIFGTMVGSMVVHNQTNADKIYYLKTNGNTTLPNDMQIALFGGVANAENMIKAERLE